MTMLHALKRAALAVALAAACLLAAPAQASTTLGGPVVGASGTYDYSPTVIQSGSIQDFFWCGGRDASDPANYSDTIKRQQYSLAGSPHITIARHTVLGEGPAGAWDSLYVCNPTVVRGIFADPLGDGAAYTWAMYYVGTSTRGGYDNSVGAAFSTDGEHWVKYPDPVIAYGNTGLGNYGFGQPNVSYVNGVETMLYELSDSAGVSHFEATSGDGVHFTAVGTVATMGLPRRGATMAGIHLGAVNGHVITSPRTLPASTPTWGGAAYDPADGRWYAAVNNDPTRPPATTGAVIERGQPGVTLYATGDLLAGAWTALDTVDTVTTGHESNFLAGLLRGPDGALYGPLLPGVELYASVSNPRPAWNAAGAQFGNSGAFNNWDVAWSLWTPAAPLRKLTRAVHSATAQHLTTAGFIDPYYAAESVNLGHLYEAPAGDAALALYSCKLGAADQFTDTDPACRGQHVIGLDGYAYAATGPGRIALYECTIPGVGDFISPDRACEHQTVDRLVGWAAP